MNALTGALSWWTPTAAAARRVFIIVAVVRRAGVGKLSVVVVHGCGRGR